MTNKNSQISLAQYWYQVAMECEGDIEDGFNVNFPDCFVGGSLDGWMQELLLTFHFMDVFQHNEDGEYWVSLDGRTDFHNLKDIKVKYIDDKKENLVLNRGHSYFHLDNLPEEEKKRFVNVGAQMIYLWMSLMNLWQTRYEETMRENRWLE